MKPYTEPECEKRPKIIGTLSKRAGIEGTISQGIRAFGMRRLSYIGLAKTHYSELRQTIEICEKYDNDFAHFESVIREIYEILGHYSPVHTNNNAALCLASLLLSKGDFHQGITFAVMGGFDTDCNGATAGSIVGAICGAKNVPDHWAGRLNTP